MSLFYNSSTAIDLPEPKREKKEDTETMKWENERH